MALYGWRLIGVGGTVLIYLAGILFLSVTNIPGPHHPKKVRIGRFGELTNVRGGGNELIGLNRKQEIIWCKELKFLDGKPNFPLETQKSVVVRRTFLKGRFRNEVAFNTKNSISENVTQITSQSLNEHRKSIARNASIDGLVALASFPGSGNTWVRYMLQQATGILTGSIYKDYGLLKSGFPAENICNKSVLVVKTHEWGPKAWEPFSKAILIIRDPEKAILAEFNRQSGGHIGFASPDRYKRTKGRYWSQFVSSKLSGWESMNLAWAKNFTGKLKIVYYDELVADVETHLKDILNFLEFKIDEMLFSCALLRKEGIFRRKKRLLTFDPYSPAMHKDIDARKMIVYKNLGHYS